MELQVKVTQVLGTQSIAKRDGGSIDKASFVGETFGQYPKKVKFDVMGEKLEQIMSSVKVGASITVSFDVESREWQGKWYTDLKCWRTQAMGQDNGGGQAQQAPQQAQAPAPTAAPSGGGDNGNDDLPF